MIDMATLRRDIYFCPACECRAFGPSASGTRWLCGTMGCASRGKPLSGPVDKLPERKLLKPRIPVSLEGAMWMQNNFELLFNDKDLWIPQGTR